MIHKIKKANKLRNAIVREQAAREKDHFSSSYFQWKAPQFVAHERGPIWVLVMATVVLALVMYGVLTQAWTFSLAILLFVGVYVLIHRENPGEVEVKVSRYGIKVGEHAYPYTRMRAFWIIYDPPDVKILSFRLTKNFLPDVVVPLGDDIDPAQLRDFLSHYLREVQDREETITELLVRMIRL